MRAERQTEGKATSKSDYSETATLNSWLRGVAFPLPSNLYAGLLGADTAESGSLGEPVGNGYARVAVPCSLTAWTAPADIGGLMEVSNASDIVFATPTGGATWSVSRIGLFTAATGGDAVYYADLTAARTILAGDPVKFPPGALKIREG